MVRHGTDRCAVTVGLALLAAVGTVEDIPLIQTIGLLSNRFGPLAAAALERLPGGAAAILWLADRVSGWGRVFVVEALCRLDDPSAHPWLLRRACDGEFLNGYFAGRVAVATRLHDAGDEFDDPEVVDHTGRLLLTMSYCEGMGTSLSTYKHSATVLAVHARQAALLPPTLERVFVLAMLAQHLTCEPLPRAVCTPAQQQELLATYRSTLDLGSWKRAAQVGLDANDQRMLTLVKFLGLRR
ncbi:MULTISPECIES: hypothetical protein [Kribbella]|uniref:hypothetical protein n=1 Tax=Kribbella TaxID=182639 RepID=UPI00104FEC7C|nr:MULTISPECIES: hypothetical protein [Kribbella]